MRNPFTKSSTAYCPLSLFFFFSFNSESIVGAAFTHEDSEIQSGLADASTRSLNFSYWIQAWKGNGGGSKSTSGYTPANHVM